MRDIGADRLEQNVPHVSLHDLSFKTDPRQVLICTAHTSTKRRHIEPRSNFCHIPAGMNSTKSAPLYLIADVATSAAPTASATTCTTFRFIGYIILSRCTGFKSGCFGACELLRRVYTGDQPYNSHRILQTQCPCITTWCTSCRLGRI